jgi:hypothetical protein
MRANLLCAIACLAILAPVDAWGKKQKGDGEIHSAQEIPEASVVQSKIPSRIELRVGERQSFRGVNAAGSSQPDTARVRVSGGVLTVLGLAEGSSELVLFPSGKPNPKQPLTPTKVRVTVRRQQP